MWYEVLDRVGFAVALKHLQDASNDLLKVSEECSHEPSRRASMLIMSIYNALIYGPVHKTTENAEAFDFANDKNAEGKLP